MRLWASSCQDDVQVLFVAGCHGDHRWLGDGHRRGDEPRHRSLREGARGVQGRGKHLKHTMTRVILYLDNHLCFKMIAIIILVMLSIFPTHIK